MSTCEVFSNWLRRQGYQIYKTKSSYWYNAAPHVLQAFPYGWLINPSEEELVNLQNQAGALAVRYSAPLDAKQGMASYHVVLTPPYSLEMLRSQARNAVKRGLQNAQVEEISFQRLASEGWLLQRDTLERQNRLKSMKQSEWEKICLSAEGLPGFKVWAATVADELASILITCQIEDTYYVPYAASHRKFLNLYVNNALFYQATCNMLKTDGINSIFFSLHSLDAPESVNEFKFRMGFQAKAVRQCVFFHPLARPFINDLSYKIISALANRYPESSFFPKTLGMISYYQKGKLPLEEQKWPKEMDA